MIKSEKFENKVYLLPIFTFPHNFWSEREGQKEILDRISTKQ